MTKKRSKTKAKTKQTKGSTTVEKEIKLSVEEQLKAELSNEKDKFLRLFAEFENYKRRLLRTRAANILI